MAYEQLKLENQLCFPVYAASRLITREYQPYLDDLGITYPQYLVFMVLWETDSQPVNEIARKLILNTNTITPLLQRMEKKGMVVRQRSADDVRKVIVSLTEKGKLLQEPASEIPGKLVAGITTENLNLEELLILKKGLNAIIGFLTEKHKNDSAILDSTD